MVGLSRVSSGEERVQYVKKVPVLLDYSFYIIRQTGRAERGLQCWTNQKLWMCSGEESVANFSQMGSCVSEVRMIVQVQYVHMYIQRSLLVTSMGLSG